MITLSSTKIVVGLIAIVGSLIALIYNRMSGRLKELETEQKALREKFELAKEVLKESDWEMKEKNLELLNIIHKDFVKKEDCKEINSKKVDKNG